MKTKFTTALILSFFLSCTYFNSTAQLVVTGGVTPVNLVNTILGGGVIATNVTVTGSANSRGTFVSPATNLGMSNGVMLSSGNVSATPNQPASNFHSDIMLGNTDPTLNSILVGQTTFDAAILEFDFSVASDSVKFNYVFGSEEYNDYVNTSFNDVFGFFINGPGLPVNKNLAIVPGTVNTPVSINNINNGGPYGGVSMGPCTNCAYFVDNINGSTIFLDAFTTVLEAKTVVAPCETYHIKLAIADVSDQVFDSDVFIEGGSFSSVGQIGIFVNGQPAQNNDTVYGCPGGTVTISLNPAGNYNWSTGASTQSIVVPVPAVGGPILQYSGFVTNPPFYSCFAYTTTIWVAPAPPTATISGNNSICAGGSTTLSANVGNTFLWSNGATTQNINVTTAGTYTVTVTNGPGCSAISAPFVVTVGPASASITGPSAICSGAAAALQANAGTNYLWSTSQTIQNISVSVTGTYTVTVTQPGGCTASASQTINLAASPSPAITGLNSICAGTLTSFNAGGPYSSYLWSNGATTQSITPLSAVVYTVTVTNVSGCTGTATQQLTINALPVPVISGVTAICGGASTNLDAGAYTSYLWTGGSTNQVLNVSASGTYTVTVTNANGCTGTASKTVTVSPNPTPAVTGTNAICAGSNTTFDGGAGFSSYSWSNGSTNQIINIAASGTYTVTVTNASGCTGTASNTLTVNPNPSTTITGVNSICQGSNTTFNGGAGFSSYNWSSGNTTQNININTAGTYTVTVTDINGCTGTSSQVLTVNNNPTPVITGVTSICQGNSTTINAGPGYSSYQWTGGFNTQTISVSATGTYTVSVTDGNGCTGTTSQQVNVNTLPSPTITGITAVCQGASANLNAGNGFTTYQWSTGSSLQVISPSVAGNYTVTVTDANGCSGSTSTNVIVSNNPTPAISGVNVICQGTPTTFDAGAGYNQYAWSNGGNAQTINPNTTGTYTVTVTDANGCTGTTSYDLTVNALPTPVITGVNSICSGTNTNFDAGAGYVTYLWSTGGNSQSVNLNASGNYTVTVTDGNGCTNSTSYALTVNALPTPIINGVTSICNGTTTNLDAGSGYISYQWSNGNNSQVLTSGTSGTYTVTVTDINGCTGSASSQLTVNPLPTPSIAGNDTICDGFNSVIDAGSGYIGYQWSNGSSTQTITVTTAGTYSVLITDLNGCTGMAAFKLEVLTAEANITANGPLGFCDGGDVILTANAGLSYLWSNGASTQSIKVDSTGTFVVTVLNNNGCSASSASINVVSHPYPIVRFSNDTSTICGALRVNFANLSTYEPGSTFKWEFGDGTSSTIASPTHDYKSVGQYFVMLTVTSPYGCEENKSDTIQVDFPPEAIPEFTMSNNLSPLFDAKIDFVDKSQNAYTWFWSFGDGDTSTEVNPSHYYDHPGDFTVKLIVSNMAGCTKEYIDHLTIAPFWIPNAFTPNGDGKNDEFFTSNYILDVMSFHMMIRNRWGQVVYDTKEFTKPWDGRGNDESISQVGVYVYDIYVKTKTGKEYNFKGTVDLIR